MKTQINQDSLHYKILIMYKDRLFKMIQQQLQMKV
jgi:hypothetical protein